VESFKRFEEFTGRRTTMEVLGGEISKVLDAYIVVTWIPNREKLQRHHGMEVRSMEENAIAADEHEHSSNNKCEDSVKTHHRIAKTALTLDKNSRKRNGEKRQEEAEVAASHDLLAISETKENRVKMRMRAIWRAWRCFRYKDIDHSILNSEHACTLLRLPRTMVSTVIFP
jgi:hypothetical protein